jgi:putative transposase
VAIGSYKYEQFANKKKKQIILSILKEYRKTAIGISKLQWQLFWKESRFNKFLDIKNLDSKLSERYKQTCQSQVVGCLESYISNISNHFNDIVYKSILSEKSKRVLIYLNAKKE